MTFSWNTAIEYGDFIGTRMLSFKEMKRSKSLRKKLRGLTNEIPRARVSNCEPSEYET